MRIQLFLILVSFLALNCKGPVGPTGPKMKGDFTGFVTLVNDDGGQPSDKSGISVEIEGTNYKTTTNIHGSYTISNLETGNYTVIYSKSGYGISKVIHYQLTGGGQVFLGTTYLCEEPNFYVSSLSFLSNLSNSNGTSISTNLSSPISGVKSIVYFINDSNSVSSNPQHYLTSLISSSNYNSGVSSSTLTTNIYRSAGFTSGSTAYLIAYGITDGGRASGYIDLMTGKYVYTNLSSISSNIITVTVP